MWYQRLGPRKQAVKWSLEDRLCISSNLSINTCGDAGMGAGPSKGKSWAETGPQLLSPNLWGAGGALELEWLFSIVWSWAKMAGLAFIRPHESVTGCRPPRGKAVTLDEALLHSWSNPWRSWQLKTLHRQHCQQLGQQILQGRGFWATYHSIHHSGKPQCLLQAHRNAGENVFF